MNIIIIVNGNAIAIDAVCRVANPPVNKRTMARQDWRIPQIACIFFFGYKSPLEDSIPNTNVAELPPVIKNVQITNIVITDMSIDNGY